jgi:hypothetical protein
MRLSCRIDRTSGTFVAFKIRGILAEIAEATHLLANPQ